MAYDTSDWSELFVASAALAGLVFVATRSLPEGSPPTSQVLGRLFLWAGGTVPFVVGGASLITETGGGLYLDRRRHPPRDSGRGGQRLGAVGRDPAVA